MSQTPAGETRLDKPETAPKAKAKSVSTRKPKETPKETPEQKREREKAERIAEELVQQEDEDKRKQAAKDAKSKRAAAENTEKAVKLRLSSARHGHLMLGTYPGMEPRKHTVKNVHQVPTLGLTMEVDKPTKKPDLLTHLAIHTAASAIGYETKGSNVRADNKADWFTPEVLRAARVFLKDLSTPQYTNTGATQVTKPGFVYYPSELSGITDESNKGRWVHLVSLGLQVSQIQWAVLRTLPFYVRGLLREVPIALIPEVCTIAALTDSDMDVLMDPHLMLWVRSKRSNRMVSQVN